MIDLKQVLRSIRTTSPYDYWLLWSDRCYRFVKNYSLFPLIAADDSAHGVDNKVVRGVEKAILFTMYQSQFMIKGVVGSVVYWLGVLQVAEAMDLLDVE